MDLQDDFNNLKQLIQETLKLQNEYLKILENEINMIINNRVVDDRKVAEVFDNLLSLIQTVEVLNLFKNLCRYYYYINKELVTEYIFFYKEMYLDEENIDIKIKKRD